jgi:hypothetical protein
LHRTWLTCAEENRIVGRKEGRKSKSGEMEEGRETIFSHSPSSLVPICNMLFSCNYFMWCRDYIDAKRYPDASYSIDYKRGETQSPLLLQPESEK